MNLKYLEGYLNYDKFYLNGNVTSLIKTVNDFDNYVCSSIFSTLGVNFCYFLLYCMNNWRSPV